MQVETRRNGFGEYLHVSIDDPAYNDYKCAILGDETVFVPTDDEHHPLVQAVKQAGYETQV